MPLVRISVPQAMPADRRRLVADGVHQALVSAAAVPTDDRFQLLQEYPPDGLHADRAYLGIERSAHVVIVQIFLNRGRTVEVKKALYASIATNLGPAGVRPQDVLVNLVEVGREDWSFGNGLMSYPPPTP